ncbi:hypothetical protein EMIT047CA2_80109 [Pseudomonas soli]
MLYEHYETFLWTGLNYISSKIIKTSPIILIGYQTVILITGLYQKFSVSPKKSVNRFNRRDY